MSDSFWTDEAHWPGRANRSITRTIEATLERAQGDAGARRLAHARMSASPGTVEGEAWAASVHCAAADVAGNIAKAYAMARYIRGDALKKEWRKRIAAVARATKGV